MGVGAGVSLLPLVSGRHSVTIATNTDALSMVSELGGLLAYSLYVFPIILKHVRPSHHQRQMPAPTLPATPPWPCCRGGKKSQ